jgi:hypothetical protein
MCEVVCKTTSELEIHDLDHHVICRCRKHWHYYSARTQVLLPGPSHLVSSTAPRAQPPGQRETGSLLMPHGLVTLVVQSAEALAHLQCAGSWLMEMESMWCGRVGWGYYGFDWISGWATLDPTHPVALPLGSLSSRHDDQTVTDCTIWTVCATIYEL